MPELPKPRVAKDDLTESEQKLVDCILRDEEFVGEEIAWGEESRDFAYKLAKIADGWVVRDEEGNPTFEDRQHTSRWKTYSSGGTPIRHQVFEDAVLGRYGVLSRPKVRARGIAFSGVLDFSYQSDMPALQFWACSFEGVTLRQARTGAFSAEYSVIGADGLDATLASVGGEVDCRRCSILGTVDAAGIDVRGQVSLSGSTCLGQILLFDADVAASIFFDDGFEAHWPVDVNGSTIGGQLNCSGAKFLDKGEDCLRADNLKVTDDVFLRDGFEAHGPVNINGSTIGGQLDCSGAKFLYEGEKCLRADNLKVTDDVFLRDGFEAHGPVNINGSTIGGQLDCSGAKFLYEGENCLRADNLNVAKSLFLKNGFEADGPVNIHGSTIGGQLACSIAKFLGEGKDCLRADNLKVTADVFLDDGFEAHGPVNINGSTIGGQLYCSSAKFLYEGENCLRADNLKVTGTVFLDDGFEAHGPVEINGSTIGGQLNCSGAKFLGEGKDCLRADNLKVTGSLFLNDGFEAHGLVNINGSTIGGQLVCRDARLLYEGENSLSAFSIKVTTDVLLDDGFEVHGPVNISSSNIGGHLSCRSAKFMDEGENCLRAGNLRVIGHVLSNNKTTLSGRADFHNASFSSAVTLDGSAQVIDLEDATIAGTLSIRSDSLGEVDLTEASIDKLDDWVALSSTVTNPRKGWWHAVRCDFTTAPNREDPKPRYKLAGVNIKALDPTFLNEDKRFWGISVKDHELGNWIEAADDGAFHADVYETFAAVLHKQGRPDLAKYLLIRKMRHLRKKMPLLRRWWEVFAKDLPIAYGYRSGQVFVGLVLAWLVCLAAVLLGNANHVYSPVGSNRSVAIDLLREKATNVRGTSIREPITLSNPIPGAPAVVRSEDLRLAEGPGFVTFCPAMYALDHLVPIISFNQKSQWDVDRTKPHAFLLVIGQWCATVFGWLLTTLFVSSFSGLIKNRN